MEIVLFIENQPFTPVEVNCSVAEQVVFAVWIGARWVEAIRVDGVERVGVVLVDGVVRHAEQKRYISRCCRRR